MFWERRRKKQSVDDDDDDDGSKKKFVFCYFCTFSSSTCRWWIFFFLQCTGASCMMDVPAVLNIEHRAGGKSQRCFFFLSKGFQKAMPSPSHTRRQTQQKNYKCLVLGSPNDLLPTRKSIARPKQRKNAGSGSLFLIHAPSFPSLYRNYPPTLTTDRRSSSHLCKCVSAQMALLFGRQHITMTLIMDMRDIEGFAIVGYRCFVALFCTGVD